MAARLALLLSVVAIVGNMAWSAVPANTAQTAQYARFPSGYYGTFH